MIRNEKALSLPRRNVARARAMSVSAEAAQRQLVLSLWIVSLLMAATVLTAVGGFLR